MRNRPAWHCPFLREHEFVPTSALPVFFKKIFFFGVRFSDNTTTMVHGNSSIERKERLREMLEAIEAKTMKRKVYQRAYRKRKAWLENKENKEKIAATNRRYYARNKEKLAAKRREKAEA